MSRRGASLASIGVAVIGTGFMGKCHAMAWRQVRAVFGGETGIRLETLCDVDAETAERRAGEFGFARWSGDWRTLLSDPAIEAVSVTTPNNLHREMAVALLDAGKHVWCEKPMALTLADAEAMAQAAGKSTAKALLGYNYILNPAVQHAKDLISDGVIGRPIHFRGQVDEDYQAAESLPWSWRSRLDTGGLGVLGDLTCHLVSIADFLCGEIASLSADTATVYATRPVPGSSDMRPVENEDVAHALLRFANGMTGVFMSSRAAHGRKNVIRVEVHGTRGMIVFDQERMNELQLFTADGPEAQRGFRTILSGPLHRPYGQFTPAPGHQLGFNDLKVIECRRFLDCIAGVSPAPVDFGRGLAIERVIHGMARSAAAKDWISLA